MRDLLCRHPTPKEAYLSEVALSLVVNRKAYKRYRFPDLNQMDSKSDLLTYMLFGTRFECEDVLDMHSLMKRNSLGITWLVPHRYSKEMTLVDPSKMVQMFLNKFDWYPKRFDFTDCDFIDKSIKADVLKLFTSSVEIISGYYPHVTSPADCLKPLWQALMSSKNSLFKSVRLSAAVANLTSLIPDLVDVLYEEPKAKGGIGSPFSGLKRIEILADLDELILDDPKSDGNLAAPMKSFIPFLDCQVSLETLIVQELQSIFRNYEYPERFGDYTYNSRLFEPFYNYLPYIILRPSFKLLRLIYCDIPINSVKSMISTFLSNPTDHDQSLEFEHCTFYCECNDIHSDSFPLVSPAMTPCVCGEYKSLSVQSSLLSIRWLFEYPKLQLKQLVLECENIAFFDFEDFDSYQTSSVDSFICIVISDGCGHTEHEIGALSKSLQLPC